jgi:hypothetical protein
VWWLWGPLPYRNLDHMNHKKINTSCFNDEPIFPYQFLILKYECQKLREIMILVNIWEFLNINTSKEYKQTCNTKTLHLSPQSPEFFDSILARFDFFVYLVHTAVSKNHLMSERFLVWFFQSKPSMGYFHGKNNRICYFTL